MGIIKLVVVAAILIAIGYFIYNMSMATKSFISFLVVMIVGSWFIYTSLIKNNQSF